MKKLIFILIAMLFITSCSRNGNDIDENITANAIIKSLYDKKDMRVLSFTSKINNEYKAEVLQPNANQVYIQTFKDNTVYFKLYNDIYAGRIKSTPAYHYLIFTDNTTKQEIHVQFFNDENSFQVGGINKIIDGYKEYILSSNSFQMRTNW